MPLRTVVLVTWLASLVVLNANSRPADACRGCKPPTEAQLLADSVRAYAGTVIAVGKNQVTIEVDAVWKGSAGKQQLKPTTCWFALKSGTRLIVLDRVTPSAWVSECLGIERDTPAARERLTKLAGAPKSP